MEQGSTVASPRPTVAKKMTSNSEPDIDLDISSHSNVAPFCDLPSSEKRAELWREFDELGTNEIRRRIGLNRYDTDTSKCARDWLSQRELSRFVDDDRALRLLVQQSNNIARDSNLVAHDAASLAQRSNSFARAANEVGEAARKEARTGSTIAILALIVATSAMALAIVIADRVSNISLSDLIKL